MAARDRVQIGAGRQQVGQDARIPTREQRGGRSFRHGRGSFGRRWPRSAASSARARSGCSRRRAPSASRRSFAVRKKVSAWGRSSRLVGVGVAIGVLTGLVAAGIAWLWQGTPWMGIVLLLAMVANLAIAGLVGAAVPLALKALRQDPALGSGVIVRSVTDCCGFFAFLGIATLLMDRL
ncbi:MAG TPA: hypothetical protein DEB06_11140 [Phycisphaerales bacterium]|nr:hypothetical protein [Phycisphaerales bacterium]